MPEPLIRLATPADIPTLDAQVRTISQTTYDWTRYLGDGSTPASPLAVVVEVGGVVVGHVGISVSAGHWIGGNRTTETPSEGWWKIHTLAVEDSVRGRGFGHALLGEVLDRCPRALMGLYGSINFLHTPAAPAWYRRQGFLISPIADLPSHGRANPVNQRMVTTADELFFTAATDTLRHFRKAPATEESETQRVERSLQKESRFLGRAGALGKDPGYRSYARKAVQASTEDCIHFQFGVMQSRIIGWDPTKRRCCEACYPGHLEAVRQFDAEDICDGCGANDPDVRLATAIEGLTLVAAGLCGRCRADRIIV